MTDTKLDQETVSPDNRVVIEIAAIIEQAKARWIAEGMERAAVIARGTNADLCQTAGEAYRTMLAAIRAAKGTGDEG